MKIVNNVRSLDRGKGVSSEGNPTMIWLYRRCAHRLYGVRRLCGTGK